VSHTEEELDAFATWEHEAWRTRAAPYARDITHLTAGAAEALLDAADVRDGTRLLDVATGPGVVALAAQERGAEVTAVDRAQEMVDIACEAGVDARQADVEQLPFDDARFDAVVAGFLLNHLPRPGKGVAEMVRVCRGPVAVSVWDVPAANPALGLFGPVVQSLELPEVVPPGPDSHLYADETRLTDLLASAGLVDVRIARIGWTVTVDPAYWFDAVAAATPRTGAVLAVATVEQQAELRQRYVELAIAEFGSGDGLVVLPAAAVVASGSAERR